MKKAILLGALGASIALIPIICNKKAVGKPESTSRISNQVNVLESTGFG